jgi:hydrogenase maturation protease
MSDATARVAVVGLGNPIMGDDGLGLVALARLLEEWELPPTVRAVDGGTWGMNLLPVLEECDAILFLDAIHANQAAGAPILLEREGLARRLGIKLSPHQVDLHEVLALMELRGTLPEQLVAIGLQPELVTLSASLTPTLACRVGEVVDRAVERLAAWGHTPIRRTEVTLA